ncbi:catalase family protein [Massilia haematophila]|uniref:Catalase family protein n=1 Tax=Massilia haematophila TaxID=457923 RepID=A0ABV7PJ83_9BURK|nr:catalase family protein [Massilia sp.]HBZ07014.1 catalase [Massilia sp.]
MILLPLPYTPDVETVAEDEARLTEEIVERMAATNRCAFERHRHGIRDAHAKSNGLLVGELEVHADLPPELRQGIFAEARTYQVVARLSSAPGDIHSDKIPAPRGFALKVMGVDGERLSPDIAGANQDFLMVNFPVLAFGTIPKYKQMLALLEANAHAPDTFQRLVAGTARGAKELVQALGLEPGATLEGLARDNHHPLGETYHTQAAIRFGDYIAKLALAPKSAEVRALAGQPLREVHDACMRDAVSAFFAEQGAEYELSAQLCVDLAAMPVEDAAIPWSEARSPHRPIATLRFPAQPSATPGRQVYGDDVLSFNPWNGIEAHRPLGGIMRIRRAAYERSSAYRHTMNARPRTEPSQPSDIPD